MLPPGMGRPDIAGIAARHPNRSPGASERGANTALLQPTQLRLSPLGATLTLPLQLRASLPQSPERKLSRKTPSATGEFTCRARGDGDVHGHVRVRVRVCASKPPPHAEQPQRQLLCSPCPRGPAFRLGVQGRTIGPSPLLFQTKDKPGSGIPRPVPRQAGRRLPPWAGAGPR